MTIYPSLNEFKNEQPFNVQFMLERIKEWSKNLEEWKNECKTACDKKKSVVKRLHHVDVFLTSMSAVFGASAVGTSLTVIGIPVGAGLGSVSALCGISSLFVKKLFSKYKSSLKVKLNKYIEVDKEVSNFNVYLAKVLKDGEIDDVEFEKLRDIYFKVSERVNSEVKNVELKNKEMEKKMYNFLGKRVDL